MKIGVLTAVHGRPAVTRLFYTAADRLKEQWKPHEVTVYVAGDEPDHEVLCERFENVWLETPNEPLGAKWNQTVLAAWNDGVDYVVPFGSDDIMSPDLAVKYKARMEQGTDFAGVYNFVAIDPRFARAARFAAYRAARRQYEPAGPARIISRKILDDLNGILYCPLHNMGLDWSMTQQIKIRAEHEVQPDLIGCESTEFVMDVKTCKNMGSFQHILDKGTWVELPYTWVIHQFPKQEREWLYWIAMGAV